MIDTLRLKSPPLSPAAAAALGDRAVHRMAFDGSSGEELWHITTAELEGSFDHRILFRLETDHSITLEGSVHKLLLGHNIYGGSDDPLACTRFLVAGIEKMFGVELPPADVWEVHKIDDARCYDLGSFEAVEGYFRAMQGVSYPRRTVSKHGFNSLHVPGRMTTLKLYHKGVEFAKNDRKRLWKMVKKCDLRIRGPELDELQDLANRYLRSEVSFRRRLVEDFGKWPLVSEVKADYLKRVHDSEMARLVREGGKEMEMVRTYMEVKARLYDQYTDLTARNLLGTWMQLSALGEEETKKGMKRSTFFLHRKQLQDAGCSWHSSDIGQVAQIFPVDFRPFSTDPRCVTGEHPKVKEQLDPFRDAV